jgi:hypothetical protein
MLSPTQRALIEPLRHGKPVPMRLLISLLYATRYDGGPGDPAHAVRQIIYKARRKLAGCRITIITVGSGNGSHGWMVHPRDVAALAEVLDQIGDGREMEGGLSLGTPTQAPGDRQ